tara:strand:- start:2438 stop:2872 length:435 start_codon:yes stop_codon:yes gene_type:complete
MQLSLDLPKFKWKQIHECLEPFKDECEPANLLCTAIEMSNFKTKPTLNERIFAFLVSTDQCPYVCPTARGFQKYKGGPGLIKDINYTYHMSLTDAQFMYKKYIETNYKMVRITPLEKSEITKEDLEDLKIDKSKPIKIIKEVSK